MANLKKLLLTTLNSFGKDSEAHPHGNGGIEDAHVVKEMGENFFRVETSRPGVDGNPDDKLVGEYLVLTDAEAIELGYHPEKGALPTKEKQYKIYRTA